MHATGLQSRHGVTTLTLIVTLALALGIRFWHLEQKNVWLDEAFAWNTARQPIPDLIRLTATDVHSPFYFILLKAWMTVAGDSPAALRSLSVVLGALAVLLAVRLAADWLPRGPALAVAGWLVVSRHLVAFSQEARMYAATTAAALAACLAYRRWYESGGSRTGALVVYAAAAGIALYLHYFAILLILACWLHLLVSAPPRRAAPPDAMPAAGAAVWRKWIVAHAVIAALYLPWLPTAVEQMVRGQPWRGSVTLSDVPRYVGFYFKEVIAGHRWGAPPVLREALVVLAVIVVVGWWRFVRWRLAGRRDERDLFLLLACLVPLGVSFALLPISGHMQLSRYLSFISPLLIIATARGWTANGRDRVATVACSLGLMASAVWLAAYFTETAKDSDLRPIAAHIERSAHASNDAPNGTVLVRPDSMVLPLGYLTRETQGVRYIRPPDEAPLADLLDSPALAGRGPAWLVIDRRWPEFAGFDPASDRRLIEIAVPGNRPEHARLFHIRR